MLSYARCRSVSLVSVCVRAAVSGRLATAGRPAARGGAAATNSSRRFTTSKAGCGADQTSDVLGRAADSGPARPAATGASSQAGGNSRAASSAGRRFPSSSSSSSSSSSPPHTLGESVRSVKDALRVFRAFDAESHHAHGLLSPRQQQRATEAVQQIFIVCANLGLYTLAAPFWYVLKRHVQASDQMNRERKRAEHVAKATTVTNEERADASTSASQQGATETVASDASPASNLAFAVPLRAVSDHVLNSAIQCISMSPLHGPDAAVKELEWVQRHQKTSGVPVRLSSHSFTPVLKAYSQRRPADLVHMRAFFNSMPLKAIVAYAIMFDAYVDGGKASDARDLLDLMRARQVPINSYTISSFLKLILSQAKRASPRSPEQQLLIDEAEQQWSHAKADHVTMLERGSVTSAMIKLYYDLDDRLDDSRVRRQIAIFDEALAIEATAMTDDAPADYVQVKCITTLLASFQRSRTPHIWREEATRLIQLTFDRAAQADRDLAAHNTSAHATRQRRLQIDPGLCFAMVSYLQECHLHTELFDVWSRLTPSQKSRDAFRPAFRACTFMSDAARAEKLMTEYERLFSRQPDVDYYISWLLCFEGSGDIDGADRVWLRMIDAGVHPSAQTLTSRARVYLRRATRQPETAAALEEVLDSILDQIAVELRASSAAVAATSAAPLAGMARRANSAKMKRIMQRCDQLAAEARHQKK